MLRLCRDSSSLLARIATAGAITAALVLTSLPTQADQAADAVKGKSVVDTYCGRCHGGKWEGESYESILALLRGMDNGKVTHRFKIKKLSDEQFRQVAAYWTPDPNGKKFKPTVQIE